MNNSMKHEIDSLQLSRKSEMDRTWVEKVCLVNWTTMKNKGQVAFRRINYCEFFLVCDHQSDDKSAMHILTLFSLFSRIVKWYYRNTIHCVIKCFAPWHVLKDIHKMTSTSQEQIFWFTTSVCKAYSYERMQSNAVLFELLACEQALCLRKGWKNRKRREGGRACRKPLGPSFQGTRCALRFCCKLLLATTDWLFSLHT